MRFVWNKVLPSWGRIPAAAMARPSLSVSVIVKIYLASDLHLEFYRNCYYPTEAVDVVVLAGDIEIGYMSMGTVEIFQKRCNSPVIFIAGNHEFYNSDIEFMLTEFRAFAAETEQVYFLENDSVEINGVRFLGCTLWTDFALHGTDRIAASKRCAGTEITDFQLIRKGSSAFTPDDAATKFQQSYAWLEQELAKPFEGDSVVITHFSPHRAAIHSDHLQKGADTLTPYFSPDCLALIERYSIKAWFYGHTHNSVDVVVENETRLVSNQRGYPGERGTYTRFDPEKIIEI